MKNTAKVLHVILFQVLYSMAELKVPPRYLVRYSTWLFAFENRHLLPRIYGAES